MFVASDVIPWPSDLLVAAATAGPVAAMLGKGFLVGLGAAVPPGPVNFEIARRSVAGGWLAGASVGFGAVTVDVLLATLLAIGWLSVIQSVAWVRLPLSVIGVGLLLYLGTMSARSAWRRFQNLSRPQTSKEGDANVFVPGDTLEYETKRESPPDQASGTFRATPLGGYGTGLLLCSTSPYQAAFWLTGVSAILAASGGGGDGGDIGWRGAVALCAGVFVATLCWVLVFTSLMSVFRRSRVAPICMDLLGGIVLTGFGLLILYGLLRPLLFA
ncbi:MAG: LysE family transporter [Planctomycetota bacterium]